MLALALWWPQLLFERVTITVVPVFTPAHELPLMLVAGAPLPPGPPPAPGPPAPPVGLSCATAMPPAVAARAVAPKAATMAFRVFIFLAFLGCMCLLLAPGLARSERTLPVIQGRSQRPWTARPAPGGSAHAKPARRG